MLSLGYFGVFLVVPLTAVVLGLLTAVVVFGSLAVAVGVGGTGALWKLLILPLAGTAAFVGRLWRTTRARFAPPSIIPLHEAQSSAYCRLVGNKALGIAKIAQAGLPTAHGFVITATGFKRRHSRSFRRALERALQRIDSRSVIVRSSFAGEDATGHSAAGIFHSEPNVPATTAQVIAAIERVFQSADSDTAKAYPTSAGTLAALIQTQVHVDKIGFAASVDPRTGFAENVLIQRSDVTSSESTELRAVSRLTHPNDAVVRVCDSLATLWKCPIECELGWFEDESFIIFQCRPLLGAPNVPTFANGGVVAFPPVPLTPISRERYVGPNGIANRLRTALNSIGLPGPNDDDVIENEGRFYLRWNGATKPNNHWRWLRAVIGLSPTPSDSHQAGAQAMVIANAWLSTAQSIAPVTDTMRAQLEANVQPCDRPGIPEELADPGYDVSWPQWNVGTLEPLSLPNIAPFKRWAFVFCLKRYRTWLIKRFEARERILVDQKQFRKSLNGTYGSPEALKQYQEQLAKTVPAVLHPGAPEVQDDTVYGPAVQGVATGPIAFDDPGDNNDVVLVLSDSRSTHSQYFDRVSGLIIERGGPLSHLVLLAREKGIPTVIGPRPQIDANTTVTIDGARGGLECIGS